MKRGRKIKVSSMGAWTIICLEYCKLRKNPDVETIISSELPEKEGMPKTFDKNRDAQSYNHAAFACGTYINKLGRPLPERIIEIAGVRQSLLHLPDERLSAIRNRFTENAEDVLRSGGKLYYPFGAFFAYGRNPS